MASSVRYIRDHLNGSFGNGASYWVEIQAYDGVGANIASGKTVTANFTPSEGALTQITNGDTNTDNYVTSADANAYVVVDLGATYDIESVTRWHYNGDNRAFYSTKTETSVDGITWLVIFDSAISGEYAEQSIGKNDPTIESVQGGLAASESGYDTASATGAVKVQGNLAATETCVDTASAAGIVKVQGSFEASESVFDTFSAFLFGEAKGFVELTLNVYSPKIDLNLTRPTISLDIYAPDIELNI